MKGKGEGEEHEEKEMETNEIARGVVFSVITEGMYLCNQIPANGS